MNKRKAGIMFVALGLVMLLEAALLYASYQKRENAAGQFSAVMLQEYHDSDVKAAESGQPQQPVQEEYEPVSNYEYREMETVSSNGLDMIGVIRVPSCGIELPVLSEWSNSLLEFAPCRYSGNIYDGNLVLMGHNYSTHFKPLKKVKIGETVEFEDVTGVVWHYCVEEIDSIHRANVEELPSSHELILFTCEEYGVYRFVARCKLVDSGAECS